MLETRCVKLCVKERRGHFKVLLSSNQQRDERPITIQVSSEELRKWNEELTSILKNLTISILSKVGSKSRIPHDGRGFVYEEFQWLARRGSVALNRIFYPDDLRVLRETMGSTARVILDLDIVVPDWYQFPLVSEWIAFPWELLYDDQADGFQCDNFWGFKFAIYRNIPLHSGRDVPRPEIELGSATFGLLANDELQHVKRHEVPFLRGLKQLLVSELSFQADYSQLSNREAFIRNRLKPFFEQEMHIVHFACHTCEPDPRRKEPSIDGYGLLLCKDFRLWPSDFVEFKLRFGDEPLVVLNACGTSPQEPRMTWNMVQVLLERGARGVVTTWCLVPDGLAAAFTKEFYPLLLDGQELGDALLETRRALLKAPYNNPLGLLYASYAAPATRVIADRQCILDILPTEHA